MLTRLAVGLLWLLHFLPFPVLAVLGRGLGALAYRLVRDRRRVCLINLEKCFPDLAPAELEALARAHFRAMGRSVIDRGVLWWSSADRIKRLVRIEGLEHFQTARKPVIILAPHFVGLDAGGTRLSMESEATTMYSRQKDPVVDALLVRMRNRFKPLQMYSRQDGLRGVIRALRRGVPFYYLPDMDFGPQESIFVPFFGVQAATITALPRLAQLTGASVVPVVTRLLPGSAGYETRFYAAWDDFPSADPVADTRRVNAFIEERVREMPEQYHWMHKRFKTRPPGEPRFY